MGNRRHCKAIRSRCLKLIHPLLWSAPLWPPESHTIACVFASSCCDRSIRFLEVPHPSHFSLSPFPDVCGCHLVLPMCVGTAPHGGLGVNVTRSCIKDSPNPEARPAPLASR